MHGFWKIYKLFVLTAIIFLSVGCKKENPNPELLDPIYLELKSYLKEHNSLLDSELKALEDAKKQLKVTTANSVERTVAQRQIQKAKKKIKKVRQRVKYLEIRTERRRVEARRDYKIAFKNNERWPDPEEYSSYKVNKKLRSADKNWNSRVPKLFEGNPNYVPSHKRLPDEEASSD